MTYGINPYNQFYTQMQTRPQVVIEKKRFFGITFCGRRSNSGRAAYAFRPSSLLGSATKMFLTQLKLRELKLVGLTQNFTRD
ncbi:MAG: hypothetical protein MZV70_76650 [Desulfobacterales bacterium]|nr:hypothetical protein [Desulfobacterales bacterium]